MVFEKTLTSLLENIFYLIQSLENPHEVRKQSKN